MASLPVLVVPPVLSFSASGGWKRVLTVYNVQNFTCHFKLLSTAPDAYFVNPAAALIPAHSALHVVIRAKPEQGGGRGGRDRTKDRFLIEMTDEKRTAKGSTIVPVGPAGALPEPPDATQIHSSAGISQQAALARYERQLRSLTSERRILLFLLALLVIILMVQTLRQPGGGCGR